MLDGYTNDPKQRLMNFISNVAKKNQQLDANSDKSQEKVLNLSDDSQVINTEIFRENSPENIATDKIAKLEQAIDEEL